MFRTQRKGIGESAFSLVELVVVLLIVVAISAIAVPRYASAVTHYRAESAAYRIASDLRFARERARSMSAARTVVFDVAHDRYSLVGESDRDHPSQAHMVVLSEAPYQAEIVSADFGGVPQAAFNGYGAPESGGSVVVAAGQFRKTVVLDASSGEVEVK